jgi:superfamily II DNA helicase RecQ
MALSDPSDALPSLDEMREAVNARFGCSPCTWQLEAALTQLSGRDLLTLVPMGSGKMLTFWIPLLFNGDGITIVITPLIVLGEKNVKELSDVSISAINLTSASISDETFKVLLIPGVFCLIHTTIFRT